MEHNKKTAEAELVVIGGGPAGMMCAATAAERGMRVILLEPNRLLGRKLRITGKGRCNVTNNCDIKTFMENPDRAMSREELLSIVWGRDYIGDLKIVDVNIRRLRLKIEEDAAAPKGVPRFFSRNGRIYRTRRSSLRARICSPRRGRTISPG